MKKKTVFAVRMEWVKTPLELFTSLAVDGVPKVLLGHPHQAGAHQEDDGEPVVKLQEADDRDQEKERVRMWPLQNC